MPAKIGRFRVVRRLGSGAFATVWLAEDDSLDSSVAIKVLADNWAHDPDVRARFEQEAQVLRRADSERLVRIHDVDELPDGRPYQIMTYAAGGTLAERLEAGPMPVRVALRTTADIARAVADLHDSRRAAPRSQTVQRAVRDGPRHRAAAGGRPRPRQVPRPRVRLHRGG
nr:hypothetical protein GCM10020092_068880 [Actinoplanes digitatis]